MEYQREDPALDAALLARLRALLTRVDPVPQDVVDTGVAAGKHIGEQQEGRTLALCADSATAAPRAGLRGVTTERTLEFRGAAATLYIGISLPTGCAGRGNLRVFGLLEPASPLAVVTVRWPRGGLDRAPDPAGSFHVSGAPRGPLALLVRDGGETPLLTPWFVA